MHAHGFLVASFLLRVFFFVQGSFLLRLGLRLLLLVVASCVDVVSHPYDSIVCTISVPTDECMFKTPTP